MKNRNQFFFLVLMTLMLSHAFKVAGQFYIEGQDPASVKWKQINTQNFQVIFPDNYQEHGSYIADLLEWAYKYAGATLQHSPRKVSVIVHTHTVIPNGFVSWAPARMELYATPPADNDYHDWIERLVVHELRHVVHVDKLNQGLTRLMSILFGEMGTGIVFAHMPLWFIEGDAVVTETTLTRAGRGRLPMFEQGLKAQIQTFGLYSFDKANFGSYKDHTPNYYELGYFMVAAARLEHGPHIWSPVMDNVGRRPWSPSPFSRELKRQTGLTTSDLYKHTYTLLDSLWTQQAAGQQFTNSKTLSPSNKLFTCYLYPQWLNDSLIVALKRGLRDIPAFVSIDMHGNERIIHRPGFVVENSFHATNEIVVWSEYRPDPRWQHQSFSEIMILYPGLKQPRQITRKGKFFSPSLSPDGLMIAVTEVSTDGKHSLVILDTYSGSELSRFSYSGNDFIMQPAWHPFENRIVLIALNSKGKRIDEIDLDRYETTVRFSAGYEADISSPRYRDNDILFNGTWNGTDNIYVLRIRENQPHKLTNAQFGAINPAINPHTGAMAYSSYTAMGYTLQLAKNKDLLNIPLLQITDESPGWHRMLANQEGAVIGPETVTRNQYAIKPYKKWNNLLNLHSWFPAYLDIDNFYAYPGASLFFQNKLSTSVGQLGYSWDDNDKTGKWVAGYSWRGWYPVIDLTAESGARRYYYKLNNRTQNFIYTESAYRLSVAIPQKTQIADYFYGFIPSLRMGLMQRQAHRNTPDSIPFPNNRYLQFRETSFYTQEYRVYAYRQRRSVPRDIWPRSGQIIDLNYRHTPFSATDDMGRIFSIRGIIYFPGVARHHGLRITGGSQTITQGENQRQRNEFAFFYNFGSILPYPRGLSGLNHRKLEYFSADYALPIWYPEISIPDIVYLKRLRGSLFYDFANAEKHPANNSGVRGTKEQLFSYGFGIAGDMHLLGFLAPVSLGLQVAFPMGTTRPAFRFNYSVSI